MATFDKIVALRAVINEEDPTEWTDEILGDYIENEGSVEAAASVIWGIKAGRYAALVDVTESGSSRKLGDLQAKALAMQKFYSAIVSERTGGISVRPSTRPIVRGT